MLRNMLRYGYFAVLCLTASAFATHYVVSPTGNDATSAGPWKTLQKAATTLVAGDTVTVDSGTYAGFVCESHSGNAAHPILFKARKKGTVTINHPLGTGPEGSNDGVVIAGQSFLIIDGFEVTGAPRAGISIIGFNDDGSDASDNIIRNCWSHNNGGTATAGRHDGIFSGFARSLTIDGNTTNNNTEHGIYVSNAADNPIIRNNTVYNNTVNGIQINADLSTGGDGLITNWLIENNIIYGNTGAAGVNLDGACSGIMRNNLLYNNSKGGITLFQGDGAEASHDNLVANNTVYDPSGSRAAIQVADGGNNNVIFNNIFYSGSGVGMEVQSVTGLVHDYNLVSNYTGTTSSTHESSPAAGTIFRSISTADFGLSASSAGLNSGIATLGGKSAPAVDILGTARPAGSGFDRGCYEMTSLTGVRTPTGPVPLQPARKVSLWYNLQGRMMKPADGPYLTIRVACPVLGGAISRCSTKKGTGVALVSF